MHNRVHPKNHEINMTEGKIFGKLIKYALPLVGTNLLQVLFNATDVAILGVLVNERAVGAVGSTGSLINLILAIFLGLSTGANVVVSRAMGANCKEDAHKAVGTSISIALVSGFILMLIGITCSRFFLGLMGTTSEFIDDATKYMTIYFIGVPIMMLYNFIASILRAVGDTFRPLMYLMIGGIINVGLNVFCILVLNLTVEGVAIATVASQCVSVVLSLIALFKSKGFAQLKLKYIRFFKKQFKLIITIGLPAGIQGALFNISNVLIQSNINAFGWKTVSGNTASAQFDGMVYTTGNAIALACMAFVSQNYGAGKVDRIKKSFWLSVLLVSIVQFSIGFIFILFADILLGIMANDPEVLEYAKIRLSIMSITYFICGIMECFSYSMRALGKSVTAMIISLIGACGFRILWVKTIFLLNPTRAMLYFAWPISWGLTVCMYCFFFFPQIKKIGNRMPLKIPPKQIQAGHLPPKQRDVVKR